MTELNEKVLTAVKAADDKRAFDIRVLEVTKLTTIADYFLICSGNSDRQVSAIAKTVEEHMEEQGFSLISKEGHRTGQWILLDFGDVVVHVFHKEARDFYKLERIWIDAKLIDIDNVI